MNRSSRYFGIACIFAMIFVMSWWWSGTTTYYIVRHAEKTAPDADELSDIGLRRAAILRDTMLDKGIDTVFYSEKNRSFQTANPLATAQSLPRVVYQTGRHDLLLERLSDIKGKEILVVSHSNLAPAVVLHLAHTAIADIAESDFDNLYVVKVSSMFNIVYRRSFEARTYGPNTP